MPSHRQLRVRELLKREIGEIIRRELPLQEAGLITVNDVGLAANLQSATVYVGIIGTPQQQKDGLRLLLQNRRRIQGLLGRSVILKYTPLLRFALDDSVQRGNRILNIIEELERSTPSS